MCKAFHIHKNLVDFSLTALPFATNIIVEGGIAPLRVKKNKHVSLPVCRECLLHIKLIKDLKHSRKKKMVTAATKKTISGDKNENIIYSIY